MLDRLFKKIAKTFLPSELKSLFIFVSLFVIVGTLFYMVVEKWSMIDAYYFSVMTLTTVGYGDITPQTDVGKIFTTIYVLGGLGIVYSFIQALTTSQTQRPIIKRMINRNREQKKPKSQKLSSN